MKASWSIGGLAILHERDLAVSAADYAPQRRRQGTPRRCGAIGFPIDTSDRAPPGASRLSLFRVRGEYRDLIDRVSVVPPATNSLGREDVGSQFHRGLAVWAVVLQRCGVLVVGAD